MTNRKKVQKEEEEISIHTIIPTKIRLTCKNFKQKEYYRLIKEREISFCSGPAGCGKSYVAIATAIELLQKTDNPYSRLVIIKPNIESSDAHLGFLKGDLRSKLEPYAASSLSIIDELVGVKNRGKLEEMGIVVIDALSFLRGKTFNNSILLMEEAQNMSINEMKTLLTRIGENSKFIISGDIDQSDRFKNITASGLYDAIERLKPMDKIGFFKFEVEDVVRNSIISEILKYYTEEPTAPERKHKKVKEVATDIDEWVSQEPTPINVGTEIKKPNKIIGWYQKYFK